VFPVAAWLVTPELPSRPANARVVEAAGEIDLLVALTLGESRAIMHATEEGGLEWGRSVWGACHGRRAGAVKPVLEKKRRVRKPRRTSFNGKWDSYGQGAQCIISIRLKGTLLRGIELPNF